MTVYFVSRHEGAKSWIRYMGQSNLLPLKVDLVLDHLSLDQVFPGDVVLGNLPLHIIECIQERGGQFVHLELDIPVELREQELTATQLAKFNARLVPYRVSSHDPIWMPGRTRRSKSARTLPACWVMLVSDELVPQLIGFNSQQTDHVLFIVTNTMTAQAESLKRLLQQTRPSIKVRQFKLNGQSYEQVRQDARDQLTGLQKAGHCEILLNITGSTKLVAMAFSSVGQELRKLGVPVKQLYVDPVQQAIEQIDPIDVPRPVKACLNLEALLLTRAKRVQSCSSSSQYWQKQSSRDGLFAELLKSTPSVIQQLNKLASEMDSAYRGVGAVKFEMVQPKSRADLGEFVLKLHPELLERLSQDLGDAMFDAGVIRRPPAVDSDCKTVSLSIARPGEIQFLKGSWFEMVLARLVRDLPGIDDWACGVRVAFSRAIKDGGENELDLVVVCGNRLLLIEAKTAVQSSLKGSKGMAKKARPAETALYKMDSIGHRVAGYFSERWYVSFLPLEEADLNHAIAMGIRVFASHTSSACSPLTALPRAIDEWVAKNKLERIDGFKRASLPVSQEWDALQQVHF